jgi:putative ABC transport system ATP-binding protein
MRINSISSISVPFQIYPESSFDGKKKEHQMALIEAIELTKVYGKGETAVTALDHVNLRIERGEFVAVMGPSGCGKSTLLHLLGGLDRPTSGAVKIDGQSLSDLSDTALAELRRRRIGFVFQFFNLIPVLDAVENAALPLMLDGLPLPEARKRAGEWLERVDMSSRKTHRPDQLSGGQQQRVAVARALVAEPALILADEPTGNLDTRAADEIAALLKQVAGEWGRSVVMVTHDPRIAAYADRIVFLKDGKVIDDTRLTSDVNAGAALLKERVEAF